MEKDLLTECDYVFPVGNVKRRTENEIQPDRAIDNAIQNAKQLISTSKCIGTYHSHPYAEHFSEWADPSNMDVSFAKYLQSPYMLIIALTRNSNIEKPLDIWYSNYDSFEFQYDKKLDGHDAPKMVNLDGEGQSICGEFQKYHFEMRAYHFDGKHLRDAKLYSSEAEMLMRLIDKKVNIPALSPEDSYSLRKIEYNLRMTNQKSHERSDRAMQNLAYHLNKIKNSMGN